MVCMTFVEPKVPVVSFHLQVIIFYQKENYFNYLTTYYLHKRDFAIVKTLLDKRGFFNRDHLSTSQGDRKKYLPRRDASSLSRPIPVDP